MRAVHAGDPWLLVIAVLTLVLAYFPGTTAYLAAGRMRNDRFASGHRRECAWIFVVCGLVTVGFVGLAGLLVYLVRGGR